MEEARFHVVDTGRRLLASFTGGSVVHQWCHRLAADSNVELSLIIRDRETRIERRVWPDRCELIASPHAKRAAMCTAAHRVVL